MDVPAGLRVQLMFAVARDVTQRKEAEGWQLATHMRTDLVMDALGMANGLRRPDSEGPSVHATAVRS